MTIFAVAVAFAAHLRAGPEAEATAATAVPIVAPVLVHIQDQQPLLAPAGDPVSLTRALQTELTRAGCYDGPVNGQWTAGSRAAMTAFNDKVNAKLPVNQPDEILLSLVKGHQQIVCAPSAVAAISPEKASSPARDGIATLIAQTTPLEPANEKPPTVAAFAAGDVISGSSGETTAEAGAAAHAPPLKSDRDEAKDRDASGAVSSVIPDAPSASEPNIRLTPKAHTQRTSLQPIHTKSRPPKFVRSLIRSVKHSLASMGF